MKNSTPRLRTRQNKEWSFIRVFLAAVAFPLIALMIADTYSGSASAHGVRTFGESEAEAFAPVSEHWWQNRSFRSPAGLSLFTSSLIVQIGFNPLNQPANFTAGISNPATQPLRVQTQRADGVGENVTGAGQTVFILLTSSSPTGRFDNNVSGAFSGSTLTVTITSGRQDSQNIFYRDSTPGTAVLTATVTSVANTGLSLNETTTITKTVMAVGVGKLEFSTQPTDVIKDSPILPAVKVRVEDSAGNLDATSTRNVSLSIENNPGGGTLNGTTTVAAVGGVATFSNLNISKAGQGYTLVASSAAPTPELTPATSAAFNVNKLDQAIEFEELPDKTYGDDSFEVAATTTSGLQVSFTSESTEICTVANSTVHIVAAGDCTIRASQAGDADHNAATFADRTFTVHKANAKVVVSEYDTVYDGQPHTAALVSIEGIAGETDATVGTADLSGTLHTDAGSYPNDVWTFTGSANYNDSSGTVNNNISKAAVTITAGNGSATFDGTSKAPSQCSVAGPGYVGDLTCTNNPASVGPQANTYAVDSDVSGSGLTNFEIAKVNGTFTIEKAPTVTTVTFENGPRIYRGIAFSATAKVTGAGGLDQAVTQVNYSGDCLNVTGQGGCMAAAVYPESTNHLGSEGDSSITIMKRPVNVAASSHVVTFGDPVPNIVPSMDGLVAGETSSVIDVPPTCSTNYTVGSLVGSYAANCSGGQDNNYNFAGANTSGIVIVNTACSGFNGFLSPIGGSNSYPNTYGQGGSFDSPVRTFKLNSTIPLKFTAICFGAPLTAGIQTLSAQKYSNGVPVSEDVISIENDAETIDNQFRFADGQWHFNFSTKKLGDAGQGTWLFEATLFDGSKYNVWLAVRK